MTLKHNYHWYWCIDPALRTGEVLFCLETPVLLEDSFFYCVLHILITSEPLTFQWFFFIWGANGTRVRRGDIRAVEGFNQNVFNSSKVCLAIRELYFLGEKIPFDSFLQRSFCALSSAKRNFKASLEEWAPNCVKTLSKTEETGAFRFQAFPSIPECVFDGVRDISKERRFFCQHDVMKLCKKIAFF